MNEPAPMDDHGTGDDPDPMDDPGTGIDPVSTIRHETGVERRDPRRCTAHNRAGAPCGKFSMRGQTVCRNHGGSSPQALAKAAAAVELAELRLRNLAPRAVAELEALVTGADSEQVRLQAANSLVGRASHRAHSRRRGDHGETTMVMNGWTRLWIVISGLWVVIVSVIAQPGAGRHGGTEAEPTDLPGYS